MKYLLALILAFALALPVNAMERPVFSEIGALATSAGGNLFSPFEGAGNSFNTATEGTIRTPMSVSGTIGDLTVTTTGVAPGAGTSYTITLLKNGSSTAVTCTISNTTTTGCSDHSDTVSVTGSGTDSIDFQITPTGFPASLTMAISYSFTGTNAGESQLCGDTVVNMPTSGTQFFSTFGGIAETLEASSTTVMPTSGTLDNLQVRLITGPGASGTYTFTVRKNSGAAATLTCSINTAGSPATCSDTNAGHAETFAAGDTVSVEVDASGTVAGRVGNWCMRWLPTTDGETPFFTRGNSVLSTVNRFPILSGKSTNNQTEATTSAPISYTAEKEYFTLPFNTSGGTWNMFYRDLLADTSLNASISAGTSQGIDTTHTVPITQGDQIGLHSSPVSSGPTVGSGQNWGVSWVSFISPAGPAATHAFTWFTSSSNLWFGSSALLWLQ